MDYDKLTQTAWERDATPAAYASGTCVHHLFAEQVARTPHAIAVATKDQALTYDQLNQRANQLAQHLQRLGVGSESCVGIYMERCLDVVVAILGVLKAGGAYVPLDPTYPENRLATMLEDAQLPIVLTQRKLMQGLPQGPSKVLCLDQDWTSIACESNENPASCTTDSNLAYIIYTSGSTGKPKGVMIPHSGLVNYLSWCIDEYALDAGQGAPVHSSIGFDLTITSLFSPLLSGKRVVLIHEDESIEALAHVLRDPGEFSLVKITPTHLHLLAGQLADATGTACTRALVIGGEALQAEHLRFWRAHYPDTRIVNEYGPTETVVGCCVYEVPPGKEDLVGPVPIGRPIANTQTYVLDEQLRLVQDGANGELYVGGAGVARGYLHRPDLTAERFVPDPFASQPGARMYKTGDLVRTLPDGNLDFIGRVDHQIKIRGFRIELGEIEAVLNEHPAVKQAVVIAREDLSPASQLPDVRLVAYVLPHHPQENLNHKLHLFLKERLPAYMIPSTFVQLDQLPLTPNGKVDREALPAPDYQRPQPAQSYVAPRSPAEQIVAEIWADVLGLQQVGVHDDFAELGGHSLLATQIAVRLGNAFQVPISLRRLFEASTVAEIAEWLTQAQATEQRKPEPPLVPVAHGDEIPLSFAQQRLWFLDQLLHGSPVYNISAAYWLNGDLDVATLHRSLNEIIRRHEGLRTTFHAVGGRPVQKVAPALTLALEMQDLQDQPAAERENKTLKVAAEEARRPFDLAVGPLLRAKLLRLSPTEQVLLLTMHHIVSDGWSMGVLYRELTVLYEAYSQGKPSPLPELPIQYADYGVWQRAYLEGEVIETQLAYWKQQLAGAPPMLDLPTDRPRPPLETFQGTNQPFALSHSLSAGLKQLCRREGVTLFMALLAAFKILLSRYTRQNDIVVGTDVANRNRVEIEEIIGFFVNQLVLRTNLAGDPSFSELLQRVRNVALDAYTYQDVPFDRLVQTLNPPRYPNRAPLFQVKLTLQNVPTTTSFSAIAVRPLLVDNGTAQLDLVLVLNETDEGLQGFWQYNTDLFNASTIDEISNHLCILIETVIASPEHTVSALNQMLDKVDGERYRLLGKESPLTRQRNRNSVGSFAQRKGVNTMTEHESAKPARRASFGESRKSLKAKPIKATQDHLIETSFLPQNDATPLVVQPAVSGVNLSDWMASNMQFVGDNLLTHGGILFRGFGLRTQEDFQNVLEATGIEMINYNESSTPRKSLGGQVYTSTEFPPEESIALHNELSAAATYPMKIWFYALQPAEQGGETPIADMRKVHNRISEPVRQAFRERGWMLIRNYNDGFGLPWQEAFHTTDKQVVEEYCHKNSIMFEWKDNDRLRTRQVRQAIKEHPVTGESVWFNHMAFWHVSSLRSSVRDVLLKDFDEQDLPYATYYGDGGRIEDSVVEEIRNAYNEETIAFLWEPGDLLMLDNMLVAHGRCPYSGPRRILVGMGEPYTRSDV